MRRKWFDIRWREKLAGGELSLGREMEVKFWWHDSRGKGFDPFFFTHTYMDNPEILDEHHPFFKR